MATFKIHLEDSMERLKRGEQVRGHVTRGDIQGVPPSDHSKVDGVEFVSEEAAQVRRTKPATGKLKLQLKN